MNLEDLRAALANANVAAFLRVLRAGESNQEEDAYSLINGGAHFSDFSRHPYDGIPTTQGGKAAGAYQYLGTTWKRYRERYGVPDFTPASQDFVAIADIAEHRALDAVEAGDLESAISLLAPEWVSLPGLGARVRRVFEQYGGTSAAAESVSETQPTAADVPQGEPMPLLLALLPAVLNLFAPRAQAALQKVTGASPDVVQQFATTVMDKVQEVTGKPDPVQAVAAITANPDPAIVQQVQESALDHLDKIMPILDKLTDIERGAWSAEIEGRDAASRRALQDKFDSAPVLVWGGLAMTGAIIIALLGMMAWQMYLSDSHDPSVALIALAGPIVTLAVKALMEVYAYRFDGNKDSAAKDVLIGQLSESSRK